MLSLRVSFTCLLRTWCINSANSTRGMQEIGLLFVLAPALRALYPAPEDLARALARYTEHTNTHPFFMPFFTGMLLGLEEQVASGLLPDGILKNFKNATAPTLSAVGDAFFSGALLPLWAISTILFLLEGWYITALTFASITFVLLTAFRVYTFYLGLRQNMRALQWIRRLDLVNWATRLKLLNAALLALLLWRLMPTDIGASWVIYATGAVLLAIAAWCIRHWQLPRLPLFVAALTLLVLAGNFF